MLNKNNNGYRFRKEVYRKGTKGVFGLRGSLPKNKVCRICKQEYQGYVRISLSNAGIECFHDSPALMVDPKLTAGEQRRISSKLAPNEHAIKGSDGVIRIVEK